MGFLVYPKLLKVWKRTTTGNIVFSMLPTNFTLVSSKTNGIHNFVERDLAVIAICQIEELSPLLIHLLQRINKNFV